MSIWRAVFPCLWVGGTGTGIKLYMKDGKLIDSDFLVFSSDSQISKTNPISTGPVDNSHSNPPPPVPSIPETNTYKKELEKKNLTTVTESTSQEKLQEMLWARLFPHHDHQIKYATNARFQGSPELTLTGTQYTSKSNKNLFIFDRSSETDLNKWKSACIQELAKEYIDEGKNDSEYKKQLIRLQAWCTESTVKAVLSRHRLTVLSTDEKQTKDDDNWKDVIAGGWFVPKHKNDQSFLKDTEWDEFLKDKKDSGITQKTEVTAEQIKTLKSKCKAILEKPFIRSSFHAPTAFINDLEDKTKLKGVDEFQEAALFCTKPMSAHDYVVKAMQGKDIDALDTNRENDFCYIKGKNVSEYKVVQTNQPFEGKTFWCAVSLLYASNSRK